jgi:hypothetical protein
MMMIRALTRTRKILAKTMVAAAAVATMLTKILNMRKVPQRLTSLAEIAETLALCGDLYKFVNLEGCDI